jgi:hypothetical protein
MARRLLILFTALLALLSIAPAAAPGAAPADPASGVQDCARAFLSAARRVYGPERGVGVGSSGPSPKV